MNHSHSPFFVSELVMTLDIKYYYILVIEINVLSTVHSTYKNHLCVCFLSLNNRLGFYSYYIVLKEAEFNALYMFQFRFFVIYHSKSL